MIDIIKGLWKWILWILIILILGGLILAFRLFVIDKDYNVKASKESNNTRKENKRGLLDEILSDYLYYSYGAYVVDGIDKAKKEVIKGYKKDEEYNYNAHNFDEAFLMYEGDQNDGGVKNVLEHLIDNSNGDFYARTSVRADNFANNVRIDYNGDVNEYQNSIRNLISEVKDEKYEISFGYGTLHSYVNEIIITKK